MTKFNSVLVANRGEIALRVMRSVREAGMYCVAIYTAADAGSPHVAFADHAVCIGEGPVGDSYLSITKIVRAAVKSDAQAIHPGYGFLSESAEFAHACAEASLIFIGPPARAIELMGNKAVAKRRMIEAKVPCIPGYEGADQSDATFVSEAAGIGFPLMIKAASGGGGRGMRIVDDADSLLNALHLAQAEAKSAFGSGEIILEKAVIRPRHVEVQVFADQHGNVVHLGERDCSVQRRHQKVVEESPCPVMTAELRTKMGAAAVEAARAVNYVGAGTVEFLLDDQGAFYFLEMNTRLQVEHPVTEMVTGRDLVALQLQVATGEPLGFAQDDVVLKGHAIEVRLYAEDPGNDFLPATGNIIEWTAPNGDGVRVDDGIVSGMAVSPFYDPMLAKLIVHGSTREAARLNLIKALQDSVLFGVATNRDFLIDVLTKENFAKGQATTAFIAEEYGDQIGAGQALKFSDIAAAAGLAYRAMQANWTAAAIGVPSEMAGWSSAGSLNTCMKLADGDVVHLITVEDNRNGALIISDGSQSVSVDVSDKGLRIAGARVDLRASLYDGASIHVVTANKSFVLNLIRTSGAAQSASDGGKITAPMHGNLLDVFVSQGDVVVPGTRLAVLEAMKMQHELLAEMHGKVSSVLGIANSQVKAGDLLIEVELSGNVD